MVVFTKLKTLWSRMYAWLHEHPWAVYIIAGIGLIVIASIITLILLYQKPVAVTPKKAVVTTKPKPKPAPVYYSPLTGEKVDSDAVTKQPVTAIMIENSPDARPQSGLKSAGVVYEAIAEGGITRFLALYQQEKPQLIGPVRSVRLYYVDWLAPYNASVAHVGGSKFALDEVRSGKYRDIDQFFNAGTYWRATDRYAPHNVYTSFERLDALNAAKGYTTSSFSGFLRGDIKQVKPATINKITINISGPLYNTAYTYDPVTNTYLRFLAGQPHNDRENGQISPSSVIAMHIDMSLVLEDGYRENITTTGSGEADIFQNGIMIKGMWHKASREAQLTFTDESGKDVSLIRGQTWITAVPNGSGSVTWE
jgi:DUF3048 family protein